jgi:NifU-like protein involved in Fe-S cluster formation
MDYSPEVQRRFVSPAGAGALDAQVSGLLVSAEAEDRTLNVWVRFQVQVLDGVIRAARFQAYGCPHMIAAADWVAESLHGKPTASLKQLDVQQISRALDIPTEKLGKLLRIEDAVSECGNRVAAGISTELKT